MWKRLVLAVTFLIGSFAIAPATADAGITGCSKWTSGTRFSSLCTTLTPYAPYYTRHVVVADCIRPWYYGGGGYTAVGDWMQVGHQSDGWCHSGIYSPKNVRILFK